MFVYNAAPGNTLLNQQLEKNFKNKFCQSVQKRCREKKREENNDGCKAFCLTRKRSKCDRTVGLMERLSQILSRKQLLTIYTTFVRRSHLDYEDIIYNKLFNDSFKENSKKFNTSQLLLLLEQQKGLLRNVCLKNLVLNLLVI